MGEVHILHHNVCYTTYYGNFVLYFRFTKDGTRFKDELDTMKFICKDLWNSVYKKQIDNLRTNHQVRSQYYSSVNF